MHVLFNLQIFCESLVISATPKLIDIFKKVGRFNYLGVILVLMLKICC